MKLLRLLGMLLAMLSWLGFGIGYAATANHSRVRSTAPAQPSAAQPIDINTADVQTLATLKGIGVNKAQAIVAYRDKNGAFKSLQDLTAVQGIGVKFLARLQKNNPGMLIVKHIA